LISILVLVSISYAVLVFARVFAGAIAQDNLTAESTWDTEDATQRLRDRENRDAESGRPAFR